MNKEYVVAFAKKLLAIDSPTGYTKKAIDFVEEEAKRFGYQKNVITKAIYGSM